MIVNTQTFPKFHQISSIINKPMDWQKEMNWEPLPPRKSRKKNGNTSAEQQSSSSSSSGAAFDSIEANILARSKINRAQTTLESRDGCAGEYYECKYHFGCAIAELQLILSLYHRS